MLLNVAEEKKKAGIAPAWMEPLFYRSQLVFASSTTSSPRPFMMARSM
nr:hypothetical protein [Pantoea allii]